MKKILAIFLSIFLCVTLVACGDKKTGKNMIQLPVGETEHAGSGDSFIGSWWCYSYNMGAGGEGNIFAEKDGFRIDISSTGNKEWAIQVCYDGFSLYEGNKYTYSFDAYSTADKVIDARIQRNGGDYMNYVVGVAGEADKNKVELTSKKQSFSFDFEMHETDKAPRLAFNMGKFDGEKEIEAKMAYNPDGTKKFNDQGVWETEILAKIYITNIKLICTYDAGNGDASDNRPDIQVNQIGYLPDASKVAVLRGDFGSKFDVIDVATGNSVFNGSIKKFGKNASSAEKCAKADFSSLKTPGTYKIVDDKGNESYTFTIGENIYGDVLNSSLMYLYYQRCGCEVINEKVGHDACHDRNATIYGTTTKIDVNGGWHDAGDYGKYVVAGATTIADLLLTYEKYGDIYKYTVDIPEAKNSTPDILDEAMYELDWMLKMQNDKGEVYHKVTTKVFPDNKTLPQNDKEELVVSPVSYSATADFAAIMAKASVAIKEFDSAKADSYLAAAKKAYSALANMAKESFVNPAEITTGEYPDSVLEDEYAWASIELYVATNEKSYLDAFNNGFADIKKLDVGFGWDNMTGFAVYTYLTNVADTDTNYSAAKKVFTKAADKLTKKLKKDAYSSTIGKVYNWGSNLTIANNAMLFLLMEDVDSTYDVKQAESQLNYLLGTNANSYCFVTGYGTLSPVNPHYRPAMATEYVTPGMLIGGPDSDFANNGNDNIATLYCADCAPALCYIDNNNSWSTNEVTIYWNAPFSFLVAGINDIYTK